MDMCPLVNDNSGLPLAAEERMSLKEGIISIPPLKNIDNGTENHTQQFFLEMKPSNKPTAPSSDDCSQVWACYVHQRSMLCTNMQNHTFIGNLK